MCPTFGQEDLDFPIGSKDRVEAPSLYSNSYGPSAGTKGRKGPRMLTNWYRYASAAVLLSFEAQRVIALRLVVLAAGGSSAQSEAQRMMVEKTVAFLRAWTLLALGRSPTSILRHYRSRVRANERRLSR